MAPTLEKKKTDPSCPFIMEIDASETRVGAILSQKQWGISKLHFIAFYS